MRIAFFAALTSLLVAAAALPAPPAPQRPREKLADEVREAIDRGVRYLKDKEGGKGSWEEGFESTLFPGGCSSLAMLALLNAGVPRDDPVIDRGLKMLRKIEPKRTYVVGLQTMVYALAAYPADRERIQNNVEWLLRARLENGWTYGAHGSDDSRVPDFSNTQYALLGLHEALRAGVRVPEADLRAIRSLYLRGQHEDGSWAYGFGGGIRGQPLMTMTVAGLCGLIITGMDLDAGKQVLRADGSAENCGLYEAQKPVANAMRWLDAQFPSELNDATVGKLAHPYYCLYGVERAGRLSGQRFIGGNDWYRVGCEYLVRIQDRNDGSWQGHGPGQQFDHWPTVSTSFALLFLSKGRTPVLLTKLAYGARGDQGWNRKHNDARHLVEFASKDLFKNQPMAWQVFDARGKEAGGDAVRGLTAELLQSPVLYFNGHDLVGWSGLDSELLREYVANGGFVFVENCCGKAREPKFDERLREVLAGIFETPLEPLPADHPVFIGKYVVPARDFPLEGIRQGCKTVLAYSPVPLAGYWEADDHKSERGRQAFELAMNVLAYATGLEAPKPRLTTVEVFSGESEREEVRRGFLKVAQLQHGGDWHPAPKAIHNLMAELRKGGLDVVLQTRDLAPSDPNLFDYRFAYMHGRKPFTVTDADKKNLRFLLKSGGLLLADACCGSKAFDGSFRAFMEQLWADDKLKLEPIPVDDPLFGKDLNGAAIATVKCRREGPDGRRPEPEYRDVPPALEGVKYNGRWVVIYSRYDLGCALEKHPAGDCLGHNFDSAVLLGRAAVLYALKR